MTVVTLALLVASLALAGAEPGFKVIAHPGIPDASLTKEEVSRVFLKKTSAWKDGTAATAIDLGPQSPVRSEFSEAVHGRSVSAVKSYWQSLIFAGRGVPPAEESSEAAVLKFVRETPGAVGYVAAGTPTPGVKVVALGAPADAPAFLEPEVARKKRIEGHEPVYPPAAQRREEEGVVVAKISISPEGSVSEVVLVQGHPAFDAAVKAAVAGWKFSPHVVNGTRVAAYTVVKFSFKLQ